MITKFMRTISVFAFYFNKLWVLGRYENMDVVFQAQKAKAKKKVPISCVSMKDESVVLTLKNT